MTPGVFSYDDQGYSVEELNHYKYKSIYRAEEEGEQARSGESGVGAGLDGYS